MRTRLVCLALGALLLSACTDQPVAPTPPSQSPLFAGLPSGTLVSTTGVPMLALPSPAGTGAYSYAVNNLGVAAGASQTGGAYFWNAAAQIHALGNGGGPKGSATAVNDNGWIVGTDRLDRAVLWHTSDPSTPVHFRDPQGYSQGATPKAINRHDQVVFHEWPYLFSRDHDPLLIPGCQSLADLNDHGIAAGQTHRSMPAVCSTRGATALPVPSNAESGRALSINNDGIAVGFVRVRTPDYSYQYRIARWHIENGTYVLTDITQATGRTGQATGVNTHGMVVGSMDTPEGQRAFLWTAAAGLTNLGTTQSTGHSHATAVNDLGIISGHSGPPFWSPTFWTVGVNLPAPPTPDLTPPVVTATVQGTLGANGWYISDVEITWTVLDPESPVTSPECTPVRLTSDTTGQTFVCTATSAGGTTSERVTVRRDASAPVVQYTGNAGRYTIDQTVSISCSAGDATSGVASSTCPGVNAPAADLGMGVHTLNASAVDRAGHNTAQSTRFEIVVTSSSLQTLTRRYVTNQGQEDMMVQRLVNAETAHLQGDTRTRNREIDHYIRAVDQQRDRSLTSPQADQLIRFARSLY